MKKIFLIIIAVLILSSCSYQLGDVDTDGKITLNDSDLIKQYMQGLSTLTRKQLDLADYNNDGVVDILDYTEIRLKALDKK